MICIVCLNAFKQFRWNDEHGLLLPNIHHQTLKELYHSAEIGCMICSALKDHWESRFASLANLPLGSSSSDGIVSCHLYTLSGRSHDSEQRHVDFSINVKDPYHEISTHDRSVGFTLEHQNNLDSFLDPTYHVEDSTGAPSAIALTHHWFRTCLKSHENCKPKNQLDWMPTRLLDIGFEDQEPIHLSESISPQPYATLSHCWGGQITHRLLQDTLTELENEVKFEKLPKTFRDAISLARNLGIKYLWIDALCIIQDSEEDWRRESLLMNKVYRYSTLNIAASDATDSHGGCFFTRTPDLKLDVVPITDKEGESIPHYLTRAPLGLLELFEDGPLYRRAWVLQERMLPSRILHCGKTQLTWQCREVVASETYPNTRPEANNSHYRQVLWQLISRPESVDRSALGDVGRLTLRLWRGLVQLYSACYLTNPGDKLIAIAGLAVGIQPVLGQYIAGMWKVGLPRDLLWVTTRPRMDSQQPRRSGIYRAPSWSWASIDGAVDYNFPGDIGVDQEVAIEEVNVVGSVGEVSSGFLRVRGKLRTATLTKDEMTTEDLLKFRNGTNFGIINLVGDPSKEQTFIDDNDEYRHPPQGVKVLPISSRIVAPDGDRSEYICLILRETKGNLFHRIGLCKIEFRIEEFSAWDHHIIAIY